MLLPFCGLLGIPNDIQPTWNATAGKLFFFLLRFFSFILVCLYNIVPSFYSSSGIIYKFNVLFWLKITSSNRKISIIPKFIIRCFV